MHFDLTDTIAAIASAPGGAARGLVRISGPQAIAAAAGLLNAEAASTLQNARRAQRVTVELNLGTLLGTVSAQVSVWPDARSYTRQPSVEVHTWGSAPILNAVLQVVCRSGARLAGPGEFTLRAFLAGRMDLTQAEAVLGVIDATSRQELDVALSQLAGGLHAPLHELRQQLLDLLAHLEAGLDFVEEDIEFITAEELAAALTNIRAALERLLEQMQSRATPASEYRVVLQGLPNAGKSSLLNALAGEAAALVSATAGTTRDYVTRRITLGGLTCDLIDTAGIDEQMAAEETPDRLGQAKAHEVAAQAHVVLLCCDASQARTAWELDQIRQIDQRHVVVLTKTDLIENTVINVITGKSPDHVCMVSSRSGAGIDTLRKHLHARLVGLASDEPSVVAGTAARCWDSLVAASQAIDRARDATLLSLGEELVAAELRMGLDELGRVVGAVYTDDVLDRIFSRFCIGK